MQTSGTAGFKLMFTRPLLLATNVRHFIRAPIHPRSNVSVSSWPHRQTGHLLHRHGQLQHLHGRLLHCRHLPTQGSLHLYADQEGPALHNTVSAFMKTPKEETQDRRDRQEDEEGEWPRQFRSEHVVFSSSLCVL